MLLLHPLGVQFQEFFVVEKLDRLGVENSGFLSTLLEPLCVVDAIFEVFEHAAKELKKVPSHSANFLLRQQALLLFSLSLDFSELLAETRL